MPPSKEARSVPVSAPTGCCLPGIRLKISLVTIKFLVKGLHVEGVRETEDRALGTETRCASVQCIHYWQDTRLQWEVEMILSVLIFCCSSLQSADKGCTVCFMLTCSDQTFDPRDLTTQICYCLVFLFYSVHWFGSDNLGCAFKRSAPVWTPILRYSAGAGWDFIGLIGFEVVKTAASSSPAWSKREEEEEVKGRCYLSSWAGWILMHGDYWNGIIFHDY